MEIYYWAARKHIPTGSWDNASGLHRVLILHMALELIGVLQPSLLDFYVNGFKKQNQND